jgi:hypothetical protein
VLLPLLACASPPAQTVDSAPSYARIQELTWTLDWDRSGLDEHDDGSWSVDTPEGELHVTGGWLTTWSVYVEDCADFIKHGPTDNGTSPGGVTEALVPLTAYTFEPMTVDLEGCAVGWVVARPDNTTADVPDEAQGASLVLDGTLNGEPVAWRSTFIMGSEVEAELPEVAEVTVVRSPAAAFSTLDLSEGEDRGLLDLLIRFTDTMDVK